MLICIPRPGPGPRQGPPRGNYHANSAPEKYYVRGQIEPPIIFNSFRNYR